MRLQDYLAEVTKIALLEPAEEKRLWFQYKTQGDLESRRILIERYQPLVVKALAPWRGNEAILMDLVQEGIIGLIEAVEKFDTERGIAFSLYAIHRIRGRMIDFLKDEHREMFVSSEEMSLEGVIADEPAVAKQVEDNFLAGKLQEAVARLPAKEQAVLSGVYLEERLPQELAETLDVSLSHIYRLQKQGVRRVRGMLSRLMQHW